MGQWAIRVSGYMGQWLSGSVAIWVSDVDLAGAEEAAKIWGGGAKYVTRTYLYGEKL